MQSDSACEQGQETMPEPEVPAGYNSELFVTPQEAHEWVLSRVNTWQAKDHETAAGDKGQNLMLAGERGVGKTWFLRSLAQDDSSLSRHAVYLDLEERADFPTAEAYVAAMKERVRAHLDNSGSLLLLDSVPPHLDESLRALEASLLWSLVTRRHTPVIMALVHPSQVCWRVPALRAGEIYPMAPFEPGQTSEQLQRLDRAGLVQEEMELDTIQEHSDGHPLLNYLLATRGETEAFESLLDYWFSRVPEAERAQVRNYLDAVCTLDVLEHASLRKALEVFCTHRPGAAGCPAHPIGVSNLLRKHWLCQPLPDAPGRLVLVASVRRAAREMLKARDAELYAKLEEATRPKKEA
jgi:hypothetical protein